MAYLGINTEEYERTAGSSEAHLPAGFYSGIVTRAEIRDNSERAKDPNGKYLEVEFDITSPSQFGNRKFWDKFNIINANQDAVRIGKEHLSDLAKALGFGVLGDSDDLLGHECCFYLEVRPAANGFQASNQCKKYLPTGSTEADYKKWLASRKKGGDTATAERPKWGGAEQAAAPAQAEKPKPAWKK